MGTKLWVLFPPNIPAAALKKIPTLTNMETNTIDEYEIILSIPDDDNDNNDDNDDDLEDVTATFQDSFASKWFATVLPHLPPDLLEVSTVR